MIIDAFSLCSLISAHEADLAPAWRSRDSVGCGSIAHSVRFSLRRSSSVVEQGTHKPLVGGSNPPSATNLHRDRISMIALAGRSSGRGSLLGSSPGP